jgi:hypothetical protein
MDVTQIPVKESCTSSERLSGGLPPGLLRYIFGIHLRYRKLFMSKRLTKRSKAVAGASPPRGRRVERPRPNRYHSFLKRLHAGGRSNMYGAIPYLMEAFALDRLEAFRIVCEWVDLQRSQADAGSGPAPPPR